MTGYPGHNAYSYLIRCSVTTALLVLGSSSCAHSNADHANAQLDAATDSSASKDLPLFSFFVTSQRAIQELADSPNGFGGDLRYGETGPGAGLRGADKLCTAIAERSLPGAGSKHWRAFLSATAGEDGRQVDAIDRIGEGPWYDRVGRLLANEKQDLLATRPNGADSAIVNDFPNEDGIPNHQPDPTQPAVDNHDVLTGSNDQGRLYSATATCLDWTSSRGDADSGRPRVGHSWPRSGGGGSTTGGFDPGFFGAGGRPAGFGPFPGDDLDGGFPPFPGDFGAGPFATDGAVPPFPGFGAFGDGGVPRRGAMGGAPSPGGPPGFAASGFGDLSSWMSSLDEAGCGAGINIVEQGAPNANNPTVGSGGGYGAFYCFALTP